MAKYYTPDISEFYVGFEYEFLNGDQWEPDEISYKDFSVDNSDGYENWFDEISKGLRDVRVKYLDVEDIKSFGFIHTTSLKGYNENFKISNLFRRLNEDYDSTMWVNVYIKYAPDIHRVTISGDISNGSMDEKFFEGVIKNKSELKRLLIQLNIIDNDYAE